MPSVTIDLTTDIEESSRSLIALQFDTEGETVTSVSVEDGNGDDVPSFVRSLANPLTVFINPQIQSDNQDITLTMVTV